MCKCPEGKKLTSDKKNCVAIVLDDLAGLKRDQAFVDKITTESSIDQGKLCMCIFCGDQNFSLVSYLNGTNSEIVCF